MRTYRVGRIIEAEVLPERFERPQDFDLAEFWRGFAADFASRMYTAEAVVRLAPGAEDLFRYTVGQDVVDKALADGQPEPGGWTRLTLPIESLTHARWLFLRMGVLVEVLEPAELRAMMTEAVADLSRLYGTAPEDDATQGP